MNILAVSLVSLVLVAVAIVALHLINRGHASVTQADIVTRSVAAFDPQDVDPANDPFRMPVAAPAVTAMDDRFLVIAAALGVPTDERHSALIGR